MKCDVCGSAEAVVHIEQMSGDEEIHLHLCEDCAAARGISATSEHTELEVSHLLAGLLEIDDDARKTRTRKSCPRCGMTLKELKSRHAFGCNECFSTFASEIRSMIRREFGDVSHSGKYPRRIETYKAYLMDMHELKRRLTTAVKEENYEEAARLRDRIEELKSFKR